VVAERPFASVTVRLTVYVPCTTKLVVKIDPDPLMGLALGAFHVNEYGGVPIDAVAVKLTGRPTGM
jgi:hypothetical protein